MIVKHMGLWSILMGQRNIVALGLAARVSICSGLVLLRFVRYRTPECRPEGSMMVSAKDLITKNSLTTGGRNKTNGQARQAWHDQKIRHEHERQDMRNVSAMNN
ncbi:hypothetical protein AMECASPLE_037288 [Ameca splendens]|uniref:Secreted protein n=1 Tax=Ameca splendens TaxID=208324 RepID=A0ABV1A395_9TELE